MTGTAKQSIIDGHAEVLSTSRQAEAPLSVRVDHLLIAEMVADGARVLDVGCGDGALLQLLAQTKYPSFRATPTAILPTIRTTLSTTRS